MIASLTINFPTFAATFLKAILNLRLTSLAMDLFTEVFATLAAAFKPAFSPNLRSTLRPVYSTAKGALANPKVKAVATSVTTQRAKLIALS